MSLKAPERLLRRPQSTFCPGCGHGIVTRLVSEVVEEMGLGEDFVFVADVACGSLATYSIDYDSIIAAHGRPVVTAAGLKRVRNDKLLLAYIGDGAAYSIGIGETLHSAMRNENVTAIVINNAVYGMTGGQMAPTTLEGQKTTTTQDGRKLTTSGQVFDMKKVFGSLDVAYIARGSVDSVPNIKKLKKYIHKAFQKQMNNEGFTMIEVMSTCPTNWGMTPVDAMQRLKNQSLHIFDLGEFIEKNREG